jgi:hypothetical protein
VRVQSGSSDEADRLPSIDGSVEIADFDTELVVLVPSTRRVHLLDPALSLVVHSCQMSHRRDQLVREFASATAQSLEDTEQWLAGALDSLTQAGIVSSVR